jgi:tetratricopeptide (TPR) repeat protein
MKKTIIISFLAFGLAACADSNRTISNQSPPNAEARKDANSLVVSSHSTPKTENPGGASQNQGESPMAKRVDVSELTAGIEKAEKEYKQKPNDAKAKEALAKAYFQRAFVLTDAAQYRAALGDFRKGLKLKPDDADAKKMHDEIIDIFKSLKREPPKEGEEPPPLPVQKG